MQKNEVGQITADFLPHVAMRNTYTIRPFYIFDTLRDLKAEMKKGHLDLEGIQNFATFYMVD